MEQQAAEKLGEAVIAGTIIQTAGTGRAAMRSGVTGALGGAVAGAVGGALADAIGDGADSKALLGYSGLMYMAVGPTRVGFFKLKQGFLKASVGDVLGILRRDAVTSMSIGGGTLTSPVTLALNDGTSLSLEVPRVHKGKAERMTAFFQGSTHG